jgi:transcriptional regulator with XRE-family HTH domain
VGSNRGDSPSQDELHTAAGSLAAYGHSLQLAREVAGVSLSEAATLTGITVSDIEALESGRVLDLPDRIETLQNLRRYVDTLELSGDAFVLAVLAAWPQAERVPHLASVTALPTFDGTITGMVQAQVPELDNVTGQVQMFDTGGVPLVRQSPPAVLKVLVTITALLVLLGSVALSQRSHLSSWYSHSKTATDHWFVDAQEAVGISTKPAQRHTHRAAAPARPKVTIIGAPGANSVTLDVNASSFTVKMAAFKYACWMRITQGTNPTPIYDQVMPGGTIRTFTVTGSMTVETASAAGRAYLYSGNRFIGFYFPTRTPFTMTLKATG